MLCRWLRDENELYVAIGCNVFENTFTNIKNVGSIVGVTVQTQSYKPIKQKSVEALTILES